MTKKLLIILLIVVVAGGAVIGGIFAWRYWQMSKQEEEPEPEVEVPTDWKTYRNEEYGFEFRYPITWGEFEECEQALLKEENRGVTYCFEENPDLRVSLESRDYKLPSLSKELLKNLTMSDWLPGSFKGIKDINNYCQSEYKDFPLNSESIPDCRIIEIDNHQAIRRDDILCSTGPTGGGGCVYHLIFLTNTHNIEYPTLIINRILRRTYERCNGDYDYHCLTEEYDFYLSKYQDELSEFEKFILTLKLTELSQIDTADWETYRNEEYGYEVRYPDNFQIDFSNPKNVFIGTNMVHRKPYGVFIRILDKGLAEEINALKTRDELTEVLEETKITISGIEATKLVLTAAIGYNDSYYLFINNDLTYELEGNASAGFEGQEYHDKILSTFKFIE